MEQTILFTGHMIDDTDREEPRFPQQLEANVRQEIYNQIEILKKNSGGSLRGLAGAASGGDILFHEVCADLKIPTEVYLALPINGFKAMSVSFAGLNWEERFDQLVKNLPVHILPGYRDFDSASIWAKANDWMLNVANKSGIENVCLVALWDQKEGDGRGGSEHMVKQVQNKGIRTYIINFK